MDVDTYFARTRKFLIDLLNKETTDRAVRSQATIWIRFTRDDVETVDLAFNSRMMTLYNLNDKNEIVTAMIEHMAQQIENPALRNSKFVFDRVLHMCIEFHRLNLTRGSSYIPLPDWLMKKKAIINPRNSDMECFKWAIIAAMKWEEVGNNPERVSKLKKYENEFGWSDLEFPVSFRDINKFESRNEIGVNILAVENRKVYICKKGKDYDRSANLMLITGDDENSNKKHYIAVKSLSRLLSSQNSKNKGIQYFCINCLNGFTSEISRDEHYNYCRSKDSVRVEMPIKDPIVKYTDGQYQFKVPFVIYADFESILVPVSSAPNDPDKSSTRGINVHKPSGWCMNGNSYGSGIDRFQQYRGKDCVGTFCERIIEEARKLYKSAPQKPMDELTKKQKEEHTNAKKCHICFKEFFSKDNKVRDHCHYTGRYRGAAHSSCNLMYRIPSYIPVVFHNLPGYDARLFIKELAKHTTDINVIAKNTENDISFSVKVEVDRYIDKAGKEKVKEMELRFIDSFKFMSSSLDSLVNNLAKGGHQFSGFEDCNSEQRELLIRKGVYPYEYMNSWDKFEETRLPSIDKFYSKLNISGISESEYQHARNVWDKFKLKNMGDYHDLYLKTDVILLTNVFESFRSVCLSNYGLDPAHFYTAPGLAWKACLKKTGVNSRYAINV